MSCALQIKKILATAPNEQQRDGSLIGCWMPVVPQTMHTGRVVYCIRAAYIAGRTPPPPNKRTHTHTHSRETMSYFFTQEIYLSVLKMANVVNSSRKKRTMNVRIWAMRYVIIVVSIPLLISLLNCYMLWHCVINTHINCYVFYYM